MQRSKDAADSDRLVAELLGASPGELESRLQSGPPLEPHAVAGFEYRGVSLGLPALIDRYFKKFRKVFIEDPHDGYVRGWNVRVRQTGMDDPRWDPLRLAGRPLVYGHFAVTPSRDGRYPNALLLDYGDGENLALDPLSRVRDYVIALDGPEALLGRMYIDLGFRLQATPSYFLLLRDAPMTRAVETPRRKLSRHTQELTRANGRSI